MTLPRALPDWPADAVEAFRERAAIMEYLGTMSRREAEAMAEERVRLEWRRRDGKR